MCGVCIKNATYGCLHTCGVAVMLKCWSWFELEAVLLLLFCSLLLCSTWRWFCSPSSSCQVYAPVDDNPEAFHRSLSLFICPDGDKLAQAGTGGQ